MASILLILNQHILNHRNTIRLWDVIADYDHIKRQQCLGCTQANENCRHGDFVISCPFRGPSLPDAAGYAAYQTPSGMALPMLLS